MQILGLHKSKSLQNLQIWRQNGEKSNFLAHIGPECFKNSEKSGQKSLEVYKNVQKVKLFGQNSSKMLKKSSFWAHRGSEIFENVQKVDFLG